MKLGVLGGTFDPVHLGHLIIAEEARVRLGLEQVLFIPTGQPWMKAGQAISPAAHRLEMAQRAVQDNPNFACSSMEVDRPGPTYTVDTLEALRRQYGEAVELYFVLGVDSLASFHRWRQPGRVLELCTLVAMGRPGHEEADMSALEAVVSWASRRIVFLQAPLIGISGTEVRQRVAQGLSIRYWVPPLVEEYIYQQGLYQGVAVHE
ncbi:MAG: nicotinate-nucleotide adenylyltransferase [Chloroflexi bacterium]|nr:nicotinate-nucleotide adenylyltransferase [Chloroflexota bacterium]